MMNKEGPEAEGTSGLGESGPGWMEVGLLSISWPLHGMFILQTLPLPATPGELSGGTSPIKPWLSALSSRKPPLDSISHSRKAVECGGPRLRGSGRLASISSATHQLFGLESVT